MSLYCILVAYRLTENVALLRQKKRSAGGIGRSAFLLKEQIWSGMLADVLKQRNIPFVQKNVLGAGLATKTGPMLESVRFYVFYKQLSEAKAIVDELFSSLNEEENED